MTEENKSVKNFPNLRFPGFEGEWEVKKFQNIVKINQGLQIPISERLMSLVDGAYFYITNEFLKENSEKKYYIKNPPPSVLCNKEDILMTRTGNTGKVVTDVEGAFHNNFFKVSYPKSISKGFLYNFLKLTRIQNQISKLAGTSTIPDLNHSDFYNIKLSFPSFQEQYKIAEFISLLDNRIVAQRKIIEQLETLMKANREKLFSQKLRFKDEQGNYFPDWKLYKLGNLGMFFSGGTPLTSNKNYYKGNIPFIKSGEINAIKTEQFISEEALKNSSAKMVNVGDILYAMYGATSGEVGICKINGAINQAILCIRTELNSLFLLNYLKLKKDNILNTYLQGGQGNLSSEIIKSLYIPVPDSAEQIKIANFLSSIQNKIETEKQILEKLKLQKKFFLANLFV